jgi:hypothetical protein
VAAHVADPVAATPSAGRAERPSGRTDPSQPNEGVLPPRDAEPWIVWDPVTEHQEALPT